MAAALRAVLRGIKEKGLTNFIRDVRDEGYL
jgi:NADH dehydrogenase (ubiquinone) 1 alpha subcomplex subunit 12